MNAMTWPPGVQCAITLTFDFDAESLWLANDRRNAERPGVLALGAYGAKVGVPRILDLLAEEEIQATFFVPGVTAETHPAVVEDVITAGHEIAHHGYTHEAPWPEKPAMVEREIDQGLETLERLFGIRPVGYRPPDGVSSGLSLELLEDRGFLYNSSYKDDVVPYRHVLADGSPGPIEIPEQPTLDDWVFGARSPQHDRPPVPKHDVLAIWTDELAELHAWGGLATIVMHPQITGRPMRLATLREFIAFARTLDGVWFATCKQVADAFETQESAPD